MFIGRVLCVVPWKVHRNPGPHRAWSRRKILRLSSHYYDRRNTCFSIAIRYVYKALSIGRAGRQQRKIDNTELNHGRVEAAGTELGVNYSQLKTELYTAGVALDAGTLQIMAQHEPRTFRALVSLAKSLSPDPGLNSLEGPPPSPVTRGML